MLTISSTTRLDTQQLAAEHLARLGSLGVVLAGLMAIVVVMF